MDERYLRNYPALSQEDQAILLDQHIFVAGCGGLGGHIIELLLRLGVGAITAVDCDAFESGNLNRQLLSSPALLGTPKAVAAAARAAEINPQVRFTALQTRIDRQNAARLIEGCDIVLDGLDNIESRKILASACSDAGIPFIHGAIGGWNVQCAVCMPGDRLMDILYPPQTAVRSSGVLSFAPAMCAAMQTALCVKLLCGKPVETGKLYLYDLMHMSANDFPL